MIANSSIAIPIGRTGAHMLARNRHILIGCASHVLNMSASEHPALALRDYSRLFPTTEITVRIAQLPDITFLRTVQDLRTVLPIWRVAICDIEAERQYFDREPFFHFARTLRNDSSSNALILTIERSNGYNAKHLDYLLELRESLSPLALHFEFEHHSWSHVAHDLRSIRASVVQHDAPQLPGMVKEIRVPGRNPIVRLLGRNKRSWFEHQPNERFEYSYTSEELSSIADRIRVLKEDSDSIRVIVATHPAFSALEAARTLIDLLSK